MSIRIEITDWMARDAREYEAKVIANLPPNPNPTGLETEGRYFKGELAQRCFEVALVQKGIGFARLSNDKGRSDTGDAIVGGRLVDVKASYRVNCDEMRRNAERGVAPQVYVPVRLEDGVGILDRWYTPEQVRAAPIAMGKAKPKGGTADYHDLPRGGGEPIEELFRQALLYDSQRLRQQRQGHQKTFTRPEAVICPGCHAAVAPADWPGHRCPS